ncbi:MAG TPA: sulfur carrier protein ThiS [Solirubrobacteraceae bacterium]|nr:sulfur carrier protein ThiS [Solirubrobacteraceae bacterium]
MIVVNGEPREVAPGTTVAALMQELDAPDRGVAVAVDGEVVPRGAWAGTTLAEDAKVEVVMAVQGG